MLNIKRILHDSCRRWLSVAIGLLTIISVPIQLHGVDLLVVSGTCGYTNYLPGGREANHFGGDFPPDSRGLVGENFA